MELLKPHSVVNKDEENVPYSEWTNAPVVAYYFIDHWIPHTKKVTENLAKLYNEWNDDEKQIEIIFINGMENPSKFAESYESMPWLTLPFGDKAAEKLFKYFQVFETPCLYLVGELGELGCYRDGLKDVEEKGEEAINGWYEYSS